jgi:hypothetical protein
MRPRRVALVVLTVAVSVVLAALALRPGDGNEQPIAHVSHQNQSTAEPRQEPPDTVEGTTTTVRGVPGGDIIPEPGTGQAPQDAGDRGGGLQIALFVIIVAGIGALAMLARREVRRSRQRETETTSR